MLVAGNVVAKKTGVQAANFTSRMITNPGGDIAEDRIVNAAGTYSGTAPLSGSGYWVMQLVAFKAASGTPPPEPTSPVVSITAPTAAAAYVTNVAALSLGGTSTDNVGVTQVSWSNNRGGSGTATGTSASVGTGCRAAIGDQCADDHRARRGGQHGYHDADSELRPDRSDGKHHDTHRGRDARDR